MMINDREYKLVLPKFSNNGRKIKPEEIEHFAKKMTDSFGGVTISPSVLGCYAGKEAGLICEENVVLSSSRDSESTKNFRDQTRKDEKLISELAHSAGKRFGQESIMVSQSKTEVSFPQGEYSKNLPDRRIGIDFFEKLI